MIIIYKNQKILSGVQHKKEGTSYHYINKIICIFSIVLKYEKFKKNFPRKI